MAKGKVRGEPWRWKLVINEQSVAGELSQGPVPAREVLFLDSVYTGLCVPGLLDSGALSQLCAHNLSQLPAAVPTTPVPQDLGPFRPYPCSFGFINMGTFLAPLPPGRRSEVGVGKNDSSYRRMGSSPGSPKVMSLLIPIPGGPHAQHTGSA